GDERRGAGRAGARGRVTGQRGVIFVPAARRRPAGGRSGRIRVGGSMPTLTRLLRIAVLGAVLGLGIPRAALAGDADAFYKQGIAYKQEGKAEEAIDAFEHAVAANPKHYMAWAALGNLYKTARKDIPKAVAAYEHAVEAPKKDKVVWT